jgi:hypothetical protein
MAAEGSVFMKFVLRLFFLLVLAISCTNVPAHSGTSLFAKVERRGCVFTIDGVAYVQGQQMLGEGTFGRVYPLVPTDDRAPKDQYVVKFFFKGRWDGSDLQMYKALPRLVPRTLPVDRASIVKQRVNGWSLERMRDANGLIARFTDPEASKIQMEMKKAKPQLSKFVDELAEELRRLSETNQYMADLYPRNIMWDTVKGRWFVVDGMHFTDRSKWMNFVEYEAQVTRRVGVFSAALDLKAGGDLDHFRAYVKAHLDLK